MANWADMHNTKDFLKEALAYLINIGNLRVYLGEKKIACGDQPVYARTDCSWIIPAQSTYSNHICNSCMAGNNYLLWQVTLKF